MARPCQHRQTRKEHKGQIKLRSERHHTMPQERLPLHYDLHAALRTREGTPIGVSLYHSRPWPCLTLAWHWLTVRWLGQEPHCLHCIGLHMPHQCCNGGAAPFHASARLDAALPLLRLALLMGKGLEPCLERATTIHIALAHRTLPRW